MSSESVPPSAKRMPADRRRELILEAATAVFGAKGYAGTTTDDVARAASVSQPYVVRLFGSKESLFLEAIGIALARLLEAFRSALPGDEERRGERMGLAYLDLMSERGMHLLLSQAFLMGGDPVIGPAARSGFHDVWTFLRQEAGYSPERARDFLANGMLINTLVGLRLSDDYGSDEGMTQLFDCVIPAKREAILKLVPRATEPW